MLPCSARSECVAADMVGACRVAQVLSQGWLDILFEDDEGEWTRYAGRHVSVGTCVHMVFTHCGHTVVKWDRGSTVRSYRTAPLAMAMYHHCFERDVDVPLRNDSTANCFMSS